MSFNPLKPHSHTLEDMPLFPSREEETEAYIVKDLPEVTQNQ